jgi:hypothetical protein
MNTTPEQRNWLKLLREGRSHQPEIQVTSVAQVNAATAYLDNLPTKRKGAFHLFLGTRYLSKLRLDKPVLFLTEKSNNFSV